MAKTLTKSDVTFDSFRVYRQPQEDGSGFLWFANCGYSVETSEGERYNKHMTVALTGPLKTKVQALFQDIRTAIRAGEEID